VAAARQGATPAGDADPYRVPPGAATDEDEDEDEAGDDDLADGGQAGDSAGPSRTVRETPAGGDRGAGYSRS
jgi:ribosome-binding factor A